jgi:quercetin dioxygenase-like cupin family protein
VPEDRTPGAGRPSEGSPPLRVTAGVSRVGLHSAPDEHGVRLDRISYLAGAHTHWHRHTGEQILYGQQGQGWVKFDGRPRVALGTGTVTHIPVGTKHWHGATPEHSVVHLAFTAGGDTIWLGEVTPEEYAHD